MSRRTADAAGPRPDAEDDGAPHPVDIYVGGRIRLRRTQLGLRQKTLASRLGVSFQAVQKYETGQSRTSASRLFEIGQTLGVSPDFFFAGYPSGSIADSLAQETWLAAAGPGSQREAAALIRAFFSIRDRSLRADVLRLLKALSGRAETPGAMAAASAPEPAAEQADEG